MHSSFSSKVLILFILSTQLACLKEKPVNNSYFSASTFLFLFCTGGKCVHWVCIGSSAFFPLSRVFFLKKNNVVRKTAQIFIYGSGKVSFEKQTKMTFYTAYKCFFKMWTITYILHEKLKVQNTKWNRWVVILCIPLEVNAPATFASDCAHPWYVALRKSPRRKCGPQIKKVPHLSFRDFHLKQGALWRLTWSCPNPSPSIVSVLLDW